MAAPVIESFNQTLLNTNSLNVPLTKPAGTSTGDLLLVIIHGVYSDTGPFSRPDGSWTDALNIKSPSALGVFWKIAGSSEPATYTFTQLLSARRLARILRISGADATNPITLTSATDELISPSVTAPAADCLLVSAIQERIGGGVWTVPGGMTLVVQGTTSGTNVSVDESAAVAYEALSSAGASGTRTWALSGGGAGHMAASIAIAPAAGGGGTDVTGTLAATETGADTAAFTGTVAVQGALAATETGSDTLAATGTVAAPGITGTLAATESGADTASFAGGVLVSGALSATETGSDVAAIAGSVSVSGALTATEAGSDTFAAAGSVLVSGSMSAQEAGNDNFAGSGSVLVSGSLAAVESGADTFAATGAVADAGGPVTGTLAAVETGSDTAAFTGQVEGGIAPAIDLPGGGYGYREAQEPDWERKRAEREERRKVVTKAFRKVFGNDETATNKHPSAAPAPVPAPAPQAAVVDSAKTEFNLNNLLTSVADIEAALADHERQSIATAADLIEEEAIVVLLLA